MSYSQFKGNRSSTISQQRSITIFLMSFVYPPTTGYLKRMDLLISWANQRFSDVTLIIPNIENISQDIIDAHLMRCDNLFLINKISRKQNKLLSLNRLLYKLITGRYPKFYSYLFLNSDLINGFSSIFEQHETDYFLNTRNNFGGLVHFLPSTIKTVFDTQDIFTEMYQKYSLNGKSKLLKKLLTGYKEKGEFVKSEADILKSYDRIIAISEADSLRYHSIQDLKNKVHKVESLGIQPKLTATACVTDKEYDLLIVASIFLATQQGIDWFINEVAPHFSKAISLCIVGSIGNYVKSQNYNIPMLTINIKGVVDSLDHYYNKSKIVPLCMLEGTGTSVKGLEALAYGAAIVSTAAGVRFGGMESEKQCLITDDPKQFAAAIELLLNDDEKRKALGVEALEYAKSNFSLESTYSNLDNAFDF